MAEGEAGRAAEAGGEQMTGGLISRKKLLERIRRAERFDLTAINGLRAAERIIKNMPAETKVVATIEIKEGKE